MKNFNLNTINKEEYLTPLSLIRSLGDFDLDPCAPIVRPWDMAKHHYTILDNGLIQPWSGRVWLNPPYGKKTFEWLDKLASHKSGLALIFARTDTIGFHKTIFNKAHAIFFFKGRLKFCNVEGTSYPCANAPSCLISYSANDSASIVNANLLGKIVYLNN